MPLSSALDTGSSKHEPITGTIGIHQTMIPSASTDLGGLPLLSGSFSIEETPLKKTCSCVNPKPYIQ